MQIFGNFYSENAGGLCPDDEPRATNTIEYTQFNNNASKDTGAISAAGAAGAFGSLAQLKGG